MQHLFMRRANLDDLPPLPPLPPGYILRTYQLSDMEPLSALMRTAFADEQWTSERLQRILIDAPDVKTVFIVDFGGHPVASASARVLPETYPNAGYVHWVAVDPRHQGQKLGYFITLVTLHEFKRMGLHDAVLETDDERLAAIKTYQNLGFEPEHKDLTHAERWAIVVSNLLTAANL